MATPIHFYSEGHKLSGDLYLPADLKPGEQRAGIVLCHGYTGVKDLYLPDNARVLNEAGYVVLTFDYKGWGTSEGSRSRLAPYSRVADVQAAMTYLGLQDCVDEDQLGIYGTSYGGATVTWVGAVDPRVKCIVSCVGVAHGARWMRSVRRPDEWVDLHALAKADREKRVLDGQSEWGERSTILLPDRQSAELAAAARANNPNAINTLPMSISTRPCNSTRNGWSTRFPRARSCSSPPMTTGWYHRRNHTPSTRKPASRKSWLRSRALGITRSMWSRPSAK